MSGRKKISVKERSGRTEQDKIGVLREFERELIGVIKENDYPLSKDAQTKIMALIDEYIERWNYE